MRIRLTRNLLIWSMVTLCVATVVCSPGCTNERRPTGGKSESATAPVRVERRTPADGIIISRYHHLRSGRMVVVKGGTEQAVAGEWLRTLTAFAGSGEADLVRQMSDLLTKDAAKGLLGLTLIKPGVRLTVSSAALPGGKETMSVNAEDLGTSRGVKVRGSTTDSMLREWLEAVKKAGSEKDFVDLVNANHAKGLTEASGAFEGVLITTLWQVK